MLLCRIPADGFLTLSDGFAAWLCRLRCGYGPLLAGDLHPCGRIAAPRRNDHVFAHGVQRRLGLRDRTRVHQPLQLGWRHPPWTASCQPLPTGDGVAVCPASAGRRELRFAGYSVGVRIMRFWIAWAWLRTTFLLPLTLGDGRDVARSQLVWKLVASESVWYNVQCIE